MRRALALLAGGAALGAGLARALRRKSGATQELPSGPDPRAGELRDKLAEAREVVAEREEVEEAETPVDEAEATGEDLAERRRKVHSHGHAVAGEMRRRSSAKRSKPEEE
jgi:ATP phosphoribosyltransferase regulatory subunit HisZ